MLPRLGGILLLNLLLVARVRADGIPGRALPLFDAYLAQSARTVTAYRTAIRIGEDPKTLAVGRVVGESAYLGSFTYRPKTYAELSQAERALLVHDPQFRDFLAGRLPPASPLPRARDGASPPPGDFRCTIDPEEMLRTRPFIVVLAP
jgi:hypothetical protein